MSTNQFPPQKIITKKQIFGNREIQHWGSRGIWNLGSPKLKKFRTWKPGNVESQKNNLQIIKIEIHVAQNVGQVWISRKKKLQAPFHAISSHFIHGPRKCKT